MVESLRPDELIELRELLDRLTPLEHINLVAKVLRGVERKGFLRRSLYSGDEVLAIVARALIRELRCSTGGFTSNTGPPGSGLTSSIT